MNTVRAMACGVGLAAFGAAAVADVRTVGAGQPYGTIQSAIDQSSDGDTVLVLPGTYVEAIDFKGKAITVRGRDGAEQTIISGQDQPVVLVRFVTGEMQGSVLQGFTVRGTQGKFGARGMEITGASPRVLNCIIRDHIIDAEGAGARVVGGSPLFVNCLFTANVAVQTSAVAASGPGRTRLINCTLTGNGAFSTLRGTIALTNCIVWGNSSAEFMPDVTATYSNIDYFKQEPFPWAGNIDADPLFTSGLRLGPSSPCIDSGDSWAFDCGPVYDLAGEPRLADIAAAIDTGAGLWPIIDMGAHEASPSDCIVDFDANTVVDSDDISAFLAAWLQAVGMGCP
jgi:hypothetical protein